MSFDSFIINENALLFYGKMTKKQKDSVQLAQNFREYLVKSTDNTRLGRSIPSIEALSILPIYQSCIGENCGADKAAGLFLLGQHYFPKRENDFLNLILIQNHLV